jgi:hypothetical protein
VKPIPIMTPDRVSLRVNREPIGTLDGTPRARLDVVILLDGQEMGHHVVLSGPTRELDAYMAGQMTLDQLKAAWTPRPALSHCRK